MPSRRAVGLYIASCLLGSSAFGCGLPDFDLGGHTCPCTAGWRCDASQRCVPDADIDAGADGGHGGGGGSAPASGITLRGQASSFASATSKAQLPVPPNVVAGDLMLMVVLASEGGLTTMTGPEGWTVVALPSGSCGGFKAWYLNRFAGASEPPTYTASFDKPDDVSVAVVAFAGVAPDAPFDSDSQPQLVGADWALPELQTTSPSTMLVAMLTATQQLDWSVPSSMKSVIERPFVAVFDGIQIAAGSTGTKIASTAGQGCGTLDFLALRPR